MNWLPASSACAELALVQHRPGADDRALDLGSSARIASSANGVRKRDFEHRQPGRDEGLGERWPNPSLPRAPARG